MSRSKPILATASLLSASLAALAATSPPAAAQQPIALPGIVIQGATLEKAPVARQPAVVSSNDGDDTPTATPKPKSQPSATAQSGAAPVAAAAQSGVADSFVAGIPAVQIAAAVTVVTARDIEQQQARTTADVLRGLPGVVVNVTGTEGGLSYVSIRGANARDTRVLIDGIEANTTKDATFDFSNLSPDDIERIEVIRGPMSALYGSGATGGVINITTKAARGPLSLSVRVEGGSFGTRDVAGRLAAGNDAGFISLTAQDRATNGFAVAPGGSIREGSRLQSFGLHGGLTLAPAVKLETTLRYTDKRTALTGFGDTDPSPDKLYQTADDSNSALIQRSYLAGVKLSWDQLNGALTQELKANTSNDVSGNHFSPLFGFVAGTNSNERDEGTRTNFSYTATYRLPNVADYGRHVITGQIGQQRETFASFSEGPYFYGFTGDGGTHARNMLSGVGEWRGTFADRLTLSAGGRRDVNDTFQNFNTWRTSASFDWKEAALRPHASLGTGVKLPGLYDQFGANTKLFVANPSLKPETSRGYDIGVEHRFYGGRAMVDLTYFASNLQNKIDGFGYDPVSGLGTSRNLPGTSTRRGIELSTSAQVTPALFLGLAYTYIDSKAPDGTPIVRVVPHGLRFDARYVFDEARGTVSLAAINNSRTPDVAFLNDGSFTPKTVDLAAYWKLQLGASYKIQPNVEIFGRIENALGAKYQEVYGYNTAGFGAYAGLKIKFDDLLGTGRK